MRYTITVEKIKCDFCDRIIAKKKALIASGKDFCNDECLDRYNEKNARQGKLFVAKED